MTAHCGDRGDIPGCGRPVLWARTTSGGRIPLDPEPVERGNLELRGGVAHWVQPEDGVARYVSHFATCDRDTEFRRPKPPRRGRAMPPPPPSQRQAPAALWDEHIAEKADPDR